MANPHRRMIAIAARLTSLIMVLSLAGCTSPLWWHNPQRGFVYKGWFVNIADQATVVRECETLPTVMGCVKPATMTAYSVNNPYILWHECRHIDKITAGAGEAEERAGDLFMALFGLNDLLTAATIAFPAPDGCGDGTMAQWQDNKFSVVQRDFGQWRILPTVEEWNRLHPDKAMPTSQLAAGAK